MPSLGFVKGFDMRREAVERTSTNKNDNRIRKKSGVKNRDKNRIQVQKKRDKRMRSLVSLMSLVLLITLGYFNFQKQRELQAKRLEYNSLMSEVISTELKRDRLRAKLENSVDLNRIQRYAIEELGMVYANNEEQSQDAAGN